MNKMMTRTFAAGVSLVLLAAPLAMAQPDQHADQHAPKAGDAGRPATAGHAPAGGHTTGPASREHTTPHVAAHTVAPDDNRGGPAGHGPVAVNHGGGHNWHSGSHYTGGRNVVDYNQYHLRRPPGGYEWVRDGNQFVLIVISSGIIASVLAANGY
jgi:Ni/Co efflux regulator RcnB